MNEEQHLIVQLQEARRQLALVYSSASWRIGNRLVTFLQRLRIRVNPKFAVAPAPKVTIDMWSPTIKGVVDFRNSDVTRCELVLRIDHVDVGSLEVVAPIRGEPAPFQLQYPFSSRTGPNASIELYSSDSLKPLRPPEEMRLPPRARDLLTSLLNPADLRTAEQYAFAPGADVAILSTFRPPTRGVRSLLRLLNSLNDAGFCVVIVDTSEVIPDEDAQILASMSSLYLRRQNLGWDFGSWLSVLQIFPDLESIAGRVLLLNDSNFGPNKPLSDVTDKPWLLGDQPDVWGITDSLQHGPHLQSYFLMLEKSALRRKLLSHFAERYQFPVEKKEIILGGEILLSEVASELGLRLAARVPFVDLHRRFVDTFENRLASTIKNDVATAFRAEHGYALDSYALGYLLSLRDDLRNGADLNPTHSLWDLVLEMGSPFIKRELIVNNPIPVAGIRESVLEAVGPEVRQDILSELYPFAPNA